MHQEYSLHAVVAVNEQIGRRWTYKPDLVKRAKPYNALMSVLFSKLLTSGSRVDCSFSCLRESHGSKPVSTKHSSIIACNFQFLVRKTREFVVAHVDFKRKMSSVQSGVSYECNTMKTLILSQFVTFLLVSTNRRSYQLCAIRNTYFFGFFWQVEQLFLH